MKNQHFPLRIGVVGTGYVATGLIRALQPCADVRVVSVLTRRDPAHLNDVPHSDRLTISPDQFLDSVDMVVECSGDVAHAAMVVEAAFARNLPVVTMAAEFQVTCGSYFVDQGILTEAEGDQTGCLAAFRENVLEMGFKPLVYGNIKGFLNHHPTPDEMRFWAKKQGIALDKVISFTDGTKVQIEQALVANGLGATILKPGLLAPAMADLAEGAMILADHAKTRGSSISDYVICPKAPKGVFIVADHDRDQHDFLRYVRLGDRSPYLLVQNYHLVHLEMIKTIRRIRDGKGILLNNSAQPTVSVSAIAKRDLLKGTRIDRAIGCFELRGEAVLIRDQPDHVPIGVLDRSILRENVVRGQIILSGDVEIEENSASQAWQTIRKRVLPS